MKIERFEDIQAWQEARKLVNIAFDIIKENRRLQSEYRLRDQFTSAVISVMANIAEGFSRRSDREFAQFLFIAKGSVPELQSHLYVLSDQSMISKSAFDEAYLQADKVARLISSFITYLTKKRPNRPYDPTTQ